MNYILCENKNNLIDKFIFFIAGFLKVIDIAGKNGYFINKSNNILYGMNIPRISYDELVIFKENIGNIISFKHIMSSTINKKVSLQFQMGSDYKVLFIINCNHNSESEFDYIDISNLSYFRMENEHLFRFFTFFKIEKVEIDEKNKKAEIVLNSIGRQKDFEFQIIDLNDGNKIRYNENKNMLEIV